MILKEKQYISLIIWSHLFIPLNILIYVKLDEHVKLDLNINVHINLAFLKQSIMKLSYSFADPKCFDEF